MTRDTFLNFIFHFYFLPQLQGFILLITFRATPATATAPLTADFLQADGNMEKNASICGKSWSNRPSASSPLNTTPLGIFSMNSVAPCGSGSILSCRGDTRPDMTRVNALHTGHFAS
jgi:hypothetical protein